MRYIQLDRGDNEIYDKPKKEKELVIGEKLSLVIKQKSTAVSEITENQSDKQKLMDYIIGNPKHLEANEVTIEELKASMNPGSYFPVRCMDNLKGFHYEKTIFYVIMNRNNDISCFLNPFYIGDIIEEISPYFFDIDSIDPDLIQTKVNTYNDAFEKEMKNLRLQHTGFYMFNDGKVLKKVIEIEKLINLLALS